ncbi:nucleic acid-binding protein [Actinomycetota bacterium]|nr:nucleic acid-binding protein [Actinomycetota bacterium]
MTVMLDTDTCIDFMRGKFPLVAERLKELVPEEVLISSIVKAELLLGAQKSKSPAHAKQLAKKFLSPFRIVPFDDAATEHYATIRADLEQRGVKIGPNDLLIAATALSLQATIVTRNVSEFSRVEGLQVETWAEIKK